MYVIGAMIICRCSRSSVLMQCCPQQNPRRLPGIKPGPLQKRMTPSSWTIARPLYSISILRSSFTANVSVDEACSITQQVVVYVSSHIRFINSHSFPSSPQGSFSGHLYKVWLLPELKDFLHEHSYYFCVSHTWRFENRILCYFTLVT
jgi:hypothetical protein